MLVEDLFSDKKQQIENSVVGWVCQLLHVIQVATQLFVELKTTALSNLSLTGTEI